MKNITIAIATILLNIAAFANNSEGDPKTMKIDSKKSKVQWIAEKVTGTHDGHVTIKEGSLTISNNEITGGEVILDMTTITVDDIKDESTNAKLKGHLLSDDFFSVAKNPASTFKLKKFSPLKSPDGNNYTVTGTLTIKGISNDISFPAKIDITGNLVTASADVTFDRTKWDIRYNSGSFFDGLGDYMIYDDVKIKFNIVAQ
jgi:polyisoprenoid-binding protein YceI